MNLLDTIAIVAYIALVFIVALIASKSKSSVLTSAEEQYLSNRDLTFTESICSIIATEVSALTFLGIPAFAFNTNFSFVQIYIGAIFGRFIIARFFLPRIYGYGLTIYEVMAKNDTLISGRRVTASFYAISKILSVGVRLFSGSILVGQFLGVSTLIGLSIVTVITFVYTLIGGLKAVVRTDILQLGIFVSAGVFAHYLIPNTDGRSWLEMMNQASLAGKTTLFDFSNLSSVIAGIMGGILFDMSTHGVDQDFAQRLTAAKSMKTGQWAIFLSSFFSISVGLIFLGIGALLWSFYQTHPFPASVPSADHLFAHFIVTYFPDGVRGIMVAGVMAATMSTLDSTINALCATVYNDILPHRTKYKLQHYFFIDNIVISILLFSVAVVASSSSSLLLLGLKVQSWTAGCLLGLFMAKVFFYKIIPFHFNKRSVLAAYLCGMSGVYINSFILENNWNWNVYYGTIFSLIALTIYSKIHPAKIFKSK